MRSPAPGTESYSTHGHTYIFRSLLIAACLLSTGFLVPRAFAVTVVQDNTSAGSIDGSTACGGSELTRTFLVSESFLLEDIDLGFNATHPNRGDIRVTLQSPASTSVVVIAESADADNDYDLALDDDVAAALDDGTADSTAAPNYHLDRSASPSNALRSFVGENVNGTWTLLICDTVGGTNDGTFQSARLTLRGPDAAAAAIDCVNPGNDGDQASLSGVVNEYYAPAASAPAGDTSLRLTSATGLAAGDKVLVIQMQDSSIDASDTDAYGDGVAGVPARGSLTDRWTGFYEFVGVASISGAAPDITVGLSSALQNSYWNRGRSTFQVIRVPQYANVTLGGSITASPWNGSTGGVVVFEAAASLDFNGQTIDVDGDGFRGGVSGDTVDPPNDTGFVRTSLDDGAAKGEGTVGTPAGSGGPGYPNGDLARGAPGNAGGGGNEHNAGGGGGGNGGIGGTGGDTWIGAPQQPYGGFGGTAFAASHRRVVLGGGGGAGASNNDSLPAGGPGGGLVIVHAYEVTGTGTISADGVAGDDSFQDAAGAGGAGGSVVLAALNGSLANLTIEALGGNGGNATFNAGDRHGPGGGGAGGAIFYSSGVGTPTTSVAGAAGGSYLPDAVPYGATAGQPGTVATFANTEIICSTLPVTLSSFASRRGRHGWTFEWTTVTETANLGFDLFGKDDGQWRRLTRQPVASHQIDSLVPGRYAFESDDSAAFEAFLLVDTDIRGRQQHHGPFGPLESYGRPPAVKPIDWQAVAAQRQNRSAEARAKRDAIVGLRVDADGIYRVRHEDLLAAGFDFAGVEIHRLALSDPNHGLVPVFVQGSSHNRRRFGPGGYVEFLGRGLADSLYTTSRLYHLFEADHALAVRLEDGRPRQRQPMRSYRANQEVHRDRLYSFAAPHGDPWYEAAILARRGEASATFPITVDAPASARDAVLEIDLWGVTDWPGLAPDHHLEVRFDGQWLGELWFDGLEARTLRFPIPAGLLVEGDHEVEIRLPGDTGFDFDLIHLDRYRLRYQRRFVARQDALTFPGRGRDIEISGLSADQVVVYSGAGSRLRGLAATRRGSADFRLRLFAPAGRDLVVAGPQALASPTLEAVHRPADDLFAGPTDYLVISHPDFLAGLDELVAAKRAAGLRVRVVDVRDLYALFSGGVFDPDAIQAYIARAHRRLGVRYVLLVGGDTYDYLDHLGQGSISFIPTLYTATDEIVRFAPADPLFGDVDGDGVPEVAVGRFPVRTTTELAVVIEKTLNQRSDRTTATFVADDASDRALTGLSRRLTGLLPEAWQHQLISLDEMSTETAHRHLLADLTAGRALINFVGHSSPTTWTFDGLLASGDIDRLTPGGGPSMVIQWGCWNTYHVAPTYDTLGHRFLLAEGAGASAVVGSSTLSKVSSDRILGPAVLERLMIPGTTLGEAMVAAKGSLAGRAGELADVLAGWTLLGDPALVLVDDGQ
ncbi:MAG: C25 family cysteine peptidase [Acidobacteriota bacterium]